MERLYQEKKIRFKISIPDGTGGTKKSMKSFRIGRPSPAELPIWAKYTGEKPGREK